MSRDLHLEDLQAGQIYHSYESITVDKDAAIDFARQFDPQPFHIDEEAGRQSLFGALALSGWYTAALTMRLFTHSDFQLAGGRIGAGIDSLQWPRPTYPGDTLRLEIEVLNVRASKTKPDRGIVTLRNRTLNQRDEVVQEIVVNVLAFRRAAEQ